MTLPLDVSRCAGRYGFDIDGERCPERTTCQRYLAWGYLDAEAGIPNYRSIPVSMAVRDCGHKIEVSEDDIEPES
jgi:hypothetical protein